MPEPHKTQFQIDNPPPDGMIKGSAEFYSYWDQLHRIAAERIRTQIQQLKLDESRFDRMVQEFYEVVESTHFWELALDDKENISRELAGEKVNGLVDFLKAQMTIEEKVEAILGDLNRSENKFNNWVFRELLAEESASAKSKKQFSEAKKVKKASKPKNWRVDCDGEQKKLILKKLSAIKQGAHKTPAEIPVAAA